MFVNKFHYVCDLCYGTIQHPPAVILSYCPGSEQRADGQTKILSGAALIKTRTEHNLAVCEVPTFSDTILRGEELTKGF
eukprot:5285691-Amphidinium_carterae.2